MASTTDYITEREFLDYIKSPAEPGDPNVIASITSGSRAVDQHCGRDFTVADADDEAGTTVRLYTPTNQDHWWVLPIDDLGSLSSLDVGVDSTNSGSYTALTIDVNYIVEPVNLRRNGVAWPYDALRAVDGVHWPLRTQPWYRDTVSVRGLFGWPAVPEAVKQATKALAALHYKLGEAALGVAGFDQFGSIRVREIPQVATLLQPFVKADAAWGIA